MSEELKRSADAILDQVVSAAPGVAGVVAWRPTGTVKSTRAPPARDAGTGGGDDDRHGVRDLLDHEGDHRHGRPAAGRGASSTSTRRPELRPEIGKLQVLEGFDAGGKPRLRAPRRESRRGCCWLHTAASATTSSTSTTNRWRASTASRASSPPPRRRSARRCCSIRASGGSTAPTSTGRARWSRASRGKRLGR